MTMNADASQDKSSTPPRGRSAYQVAVDYAKKSRRHYDEAVAVSAEYFQRAQEGEFGSSMIMAEIASTEDVRWKRAVQEQQFAERLTNMYTGIAAMDFLQLMWREQQETNRLLREISQK